MGKTIKRNDPFTKKYSKKKHIKNKTVGNRDHNETSKVHEKDHFPRKIWPVTNEIHKGPKF